MQREIKFRFYSEELKKFVPDPRAWIGSDGSLVLEKEGAGNIVIQQFTGLKDKNGREIFEGDIVKGDTTNFTTKLKEESYIGKIVYEDSYFCLYPHFKLFVLSDLEVIGNIFENPDLIK